MSDPQDPNLERLLGALETIGQTLDSEVLRPDPDAKGWDLRELQQIWQRVESDALPALELLEPMLPSDQLAGAKAAVAGVAVEIATLAALTGDTKLARNAQSVAEQLSADELAAEIAAAGRDRDAHARLMFGRWLHRRNDWSGGDRVLRAIQTEDATLREGVQRALDAPRPLEGGAPSLFTLNGFGLMLYGDRDRREDGTYIATHFVTALFMPIWPLGAYRVLQQGDQYLFLAKERLSNTARWWRRLIVGGSVLAIVAVLVASWWNSPENRAGRQLEDIAALEATQPAEAIAAYQTFLGDLGKDAPEGAARAAGRMTELLLAQVAEPMTVERTEEAERLAIRVNHLPAGRPEAAGMLYTAIGRWSDQVGADDLAHAEARARLASIALRVAGSRREEALEGARLAQGAVAERLEGDWPLAALRRYGAHIEHPDTASRFASLVPRIESPEALADLRPTAESFVRLHGSSHAAAAQHIDEKLGESERRRMDPERSAALESEDADLIRAQLERFPGDQSLTAALTHQLRSVGKAEEASALWSSVSPGAMSSDALEAFALSLRDEGRLEQADALLSRHVRELLPTYQQAAQRFDEAVTAFVDGLDRQMDRGEYPPVLESMLRGATSQEDAQAKYRDYVQSHLSSDAELSSLRARAESTSGIVPAALALAMIKLQRAEGSDPETRAALLAEAERLFLSIRQEAEGAPEFHLGLGKVYHRLGRPEEGDAELTRLVSQGPAMELMVARVYRELGLHTRARTHARSSYEAGSEEPVRGDAAILMSLLASDLDEEETWLQRAPQDMAFVRNGLTTVRARRAFREGDLSVAASLHAQVAAAFEREADVNPASTNNAAVALQEKYRCTGDPRDIDRAIQLLERALRQSPDSAVVVGNLASALGRRGRLRVLDTVVRTRALRLDASSARTLLGALVSARREALLPRLRSEPSLRRSMDLWRQAAVLAPENPLPHFEELGWCHQVEDDACIQRVHERVSSVAFHDADAAADYEGWLAGEDEEKERRELAEEVTNATAVLESAQATRHTPTIMAARLLAADVRYGVARAERDAESMRAVAAEYGAIDGEWADVDLGERRGATLLHGALLGASTGDFREALDARGRALGPMLFMHHVAESPEWMSALAARPEVSQALEAFRAARPNPSVDRWVFARAMGATDLARREEPQRATALVELAAKARLQPWRLDRQLRLELFQAR